MKRYYVSNNDITNFTFLYLKVLETCKFADELCSNGHLEADSIRSRKNALKEKYHIKVILVSL